MKDAQGVPETAELMLPCREYEASYREYIAELGDEERYPFPLDFVHDDFAALLKRLDDFSDGIELPDGFVPSSTYWLVEAGELIGVSNLRHVLNQRIMHCGGHVGLGVRPSCRGRGLGGKLLALTIAEARRKGIGDIHIHCHKHNEASMRMIASTGALLDSEVQEPGSEVLILRYVLRQTVGAR